MRSLALTVLLVSAAASAQPDFRPAPEGASFSFDGLLGLGDNLDVIVVDSEGALIGEARVGTFTSAALLSGRVPAGPVDVAFELPFGYVVYDYPSTLFEESTREGDGLVGNPYLGVAADIGPVEIESGVRLPLARLEQPDGDGPYADAAVVGPTLDPERFEAYAPDLFSALVTVRASRQLSPRLRADVRLTPAFFVETGDEPDFAGGDTVTNPADAAIGYGLRLTADAGPLALHAGLAGRQFLTQERYDVYALDATAVLGAVYTAGPVQPGILVRIPTAEGDYFGTDAVVGVSLTVAR